MGDEETKNLLKTCAENLLNAVSQLENRPQGSSHVDPMAPVAPVAPEAAGLPVVEEHRRLFGFRPPNNSRASTSSRSGKQPAPKRRMVATSTGEQISIPVRNTWTRTFVCLEKKNATTPPSAFEKVSMALAGLEEKSICFAKGGNSQHVHEKILEAFPILENAGGYEILRTGERGNRQLMVLSMPPGGYTVPYLKATIASAKGYIRPLQKDLVFSPSEQEQMQISISPKVSCINCKSQVPMDLLRKHEETCAGGSSGTITTSRETDQSGPEVVSIGITATPPNDGKVKELQVLFPGVPDHTVSAALQVSSGDVNEAANTLLLAESSNDNSTGLSPHAVSNSPFDNIDGGDDDDDLLVNMLAEDEQKTEDSSLQTVLTRINNKLTGRPLKETIDPTDILNDAMAIYKNHRFDETRPLRISFTGQPAIDTGGPRREFFDQVFAKLADFDNNTGFCQLFEGPPTRLVPVYNARIAFPGLMKCVGRIIAHAIAQCEIGFPKLSPVCYWYLINQDVSEAISYANISDIRDISVADYIRKIVVADSEQMNLINQDSQFIDLLSESGCTTTLTMENKDEIVQFIMCHFVLNKRKVLLDQLHEGLKILGVLDEMKARPLLFEPFFVYHEGSVTPERVKEVLSFLDAGEHKDQKDMFIRFIEESKNNELLQFLRFTTGACTVPSAGDITVTFDAMDDAIFASTCLQALKLPRHLEDYETFKTGLVVAMEDKKPNFNVP